MNPLPILLLRSLLRGIACAGLLSAAAVVLALPGSALPLLSEVLYDASGPDDGAVFVELWGPAGMPLDGLSVEGVNGSDGSVTVSVPLSGAIPADGFFVLADSGAGGGTSVAEADLVIDFDFQNGPDSVRLLAGATVLDAVGYGVFGSGDVFAGEGSPASDPASGSSIARHFADVDSGDNAADFLALAEPTPGVAPLAGVPEPASAALLALGLGALGARRRGRPAGPV